jgi:hypothetical protein
MKQLVRQPPIPSQNAPGSIDEGAGKPKSPATTLVLYHCGALWEPLKIAARQWRTRQAGDTLQRDRWRKVGQNILRLILTVGLNHPFGGHACSRAHGLRHGLAENCPRTLAYKVQKCWG